MSKSYIKAFYGIDGENIDQIGYGRTFDAAKSLNYDSDGLVWHEDISDIKTTTISDALTTATGTNGQAVAATDTTCDTVVTGTIRINNGGGYPAGTTGDMATDNGTASSYFGVGDELVNSNGIRIGRVTASASGTVTCSAGTLIDVLDDETLYRTMTISCNESSDIALYMGVAGSGIPVDTYVTYVEHAGSTAGAVTRFNVNNAVATGFTNGTCVFKSNFVSVASIDDINRGDAGMIVTTTSTIDAAGAHTSTERMLLNPINQTDKVLKLFRPYQSGVAAHASGSTLYIFPKTKSYVSELIPTDNIRNISSFQLKLESGSGVPSQFEVEDITIVYRIKGVR